METDEEPRVLPFQLQFDKPLASQIKIAEWNPEKDLLAMVTEDSKIMLHRFNWQRLWTIAPDLTILQSCLSILRKFFQGRCITSLCWRPDGKAIAVGLEDGTISLHDVENGKLLRSLKSHTVAVVCLNWEVEGWPLADDPCNFRTYEDRTPRFFPHAPRCPTMPGVVSGDTGFLEDGGDSYQELSDSSCQRFNILCSGDTNGSICFSIFGVFPVGEVNVHNICVSLPFGDKQATYSLSNASIYKVALSKDLCRLIVTCSGKLNANMAEARENLVDQYGVHGLHNLVLDTAIFSRRKNELHQLAQQASNIEELTEVIRASLSVMCKQWSDAMHTFHDKFDSLSTLITDHAMDSSPQEEFLSLLFGARTSPPVHQFLVNSLGEAAVKRVAKVVCGAAKELQRIVLDHLQPAAEIIGFRMGELRGLSRWRARYLAIGLDEMLINNATEKSGMMLVQVERFMRVLSSVEQQFSNFFNWLLKCIKLLMQEPSDQLLPYNSELLVIFLKFLYDQDPVKQLLEHSEIDQDIDVGIETMQRVKECIQFGGFSDSEYLQRTVAKEFQQLESCFKEAFMTPFATISRKILCEDLLPLFPILSSALMPVTVPMSISYFEDASGSLPQASECGFVDYICFQVPSEACAKNANFVGITRGLMHDFGSLKNGYTSLETVLLSIPPGYQCVDISLYKDSQIVMLLNETTDSSESAGNACMMIVQASELPFTSVSRSTCLDLWNLYKLKDSVVHVQLGNEKVRNIPHSVIAPLAVSASRGVACVFAARKRALVYILDEDEEVADAE